MLKQRRNTLNFSLNGHIPLTDAAVSLWSKTSDPAEEWPEWSQPVGAHDAYAFGAKVSHNGKHWTSTTANNVWEPGVYGWEEVA